MHPILIFVIAIAVMDLIIVMAAIYVGSGGKNRNYCEDCPARLICERDRRQYCREEKGSKK